MLVPLAIVFLLLKEACHVNCAIIGTKHHVNNIFNEGKQAEDNLAKISTGTKSIVNQPGHGQNATNDNIDQNQSAKIISPMKIGTPLVLNKKTTVHDMISRQPLHLTLPNNKKAPDDFLKQETPKLEKKLYHRFTVDDFIKRRKELKEKWQARHNKLYRMVQHGLHDNIEDHAKSESKHPEILHGVGKQAARWNSPVLLHMAPHGVHDKIEDHSISVPKHPEALHGVEKQAARWNPPMQAATKKENMARVNSENLRRNIGALYEQVTPRTRRILEHKEEEIQSVEENTEPLHSLKTKHGFFAKLQPRSSLPTLPPTNGRTESIQSEMKTTLLQFNGAKSGLSSEEPTSEINDAKHTTESNFNFANYEYEYPPYVKPLFPELYWPIATNIQSSNSTPSKRRESSPLSKLKPSSIPTSPTVGAERFLHDDQTIEPRNSHTGSLKTVAPSKTSFKNQAADLDSERVALLNADHKFDDETRLGFAQEIITTTSPFLKNLTDQQKKILIVPTMMYGKARASDVHRTIDDFDDETRLGFAPEIITTTSPFLKNLTDQQKKILIVPTMMYGKARASDVHRTIDDEEADHKFDDETRLGFAPEIITTTSPFLKNLTDQQKKSLIVPTLMYGKARASDVHLTIDDEEADHKFDDETRLGFAPEIITTTSPFLKNLTDQQKKILIVPTMMYGKARASDVHRTIDDDEADHKFDDETRLGFAPEIITTTSPFLKNLTDQQKKILIVPTMMYGKARASDVHRTIDDEEADHKFDDETRLGFAPEIITTTSPFLKNLTDQQKKILIVPTMMYGKARASDVHRTIDDEEADHKFDDETRLGFAPEIITTTSPFLKNLTDQQKKSLIVPTLMYGKARASDIHRTIDNEEVTEKKYTPSNHNSTDDKNIPESLFHGESAGVGVTQKSVESGTQISMVNDEESLEHLAGKPESSAMKIAAEPLVNQDWREHLRKAVRERLRKLRRDSVEN